MEYPIWVWIGFFAFVFVALALDLGVFNREARTPKKSEVFVWSIVWVSMALIFNAFVLWQFGAIQAKQFLTGYLIELSLSVDNLFVFLLIFSYFKVPKKHQHRVLFWGIFMALMLRLVMIFLGAEFVERAHWILYFFGAFLVYTGIKMFGEDDDGFNPEESWIVGFTTRYIRISKHYDGENFFIKKDGQTVGTLLLLVLIVINLADIVFAVDSIPAIFGITTDRFIIYTSNIFAILGLRTFFFLLSSVAETFHYLKYGLAFVLSFIGVKMLLPLAAEISPFIFGANNPQFFLDFQAKKYDDTLITVSLIIVVLALILSVVFSLLFPPKVQATENSD